MDKNIIYCPPSQVVAAGTNRNIMQAGYSGRQTWEQDFNERIDYLQYKIDKLTQVQQNSKQAGGSIKQVSPEEQRNLKQAAILNNASDREIMDTMLGFTNGEISIEHLPYATAEARINRNKSIKQAGVGIDKQHEEDITKIQTLLEFGGVL